MRTVLILAALAILSVNLHAQTAIGDSVKKYHKEYSAYMRRVWDSVRQSDSGRYFAERQRHLKDGSKSYTAFLLYTEATAADFTKLNAAIARDGFGPLSGPVWRIGFGVSHKGYNGVMIDFNYAVLGFNHRIKSGDSKITTIFYNLFGLELGYSVVNGTRFNVYPYAGLSMRSTSIDYSAPATLNPNYNSIASLVTNDRSVTGTNFNLGYEAGLGIDYAIYINKKTHGGTMVFGKFGTDGIFNNESYKISGLNYTPGIQYGAWIAELGFKFFGR